MRKSRFSEDQRKAIVDETKSGVSVRKACCRYDISPATFYGWRRRFEKAESDRLSSSLDH